jgi:hypothetical protein
MRSLLVVVLHEPIYLRLQFSAHTGPHTSLQGCFLGPLFTRSVQDDYVASIALLSAPFVTDRNVTCTFTWLAR